MFDVRFLPNPHYQLALRPLTGIDARVVEFIPKPTQKAVEIRYDPGPNGRRMPEWLSIADVRRALKYQDFFAAD